MATCFTLLATPHLLLYDLAFVAIPAALLLRYNWKLSVALVAASSAVALPLYAATNVSLVPFLLIYLIVGLTWRYAGQGHFAMLAPQQPQTTQLQTP